MNRRRPHALLLEPDDALRHLLADALSDLGFAVSAGKGRRQVLDLLLNGVDVDVILLDLIESEGGGRALLSFLREQPETAVIPVIVMVDGDPADRPLGAARLSKPFGLDDLRAALREALSRNRTAPPAEQAPPQPH